MSKVLSTRGDEHLSSNTYEAISHMEVAMGTTLIIPEFRSESVPTTMDELVHSYGRDARKRRRRTAVPKRRRPSPRKNTRIGGAASKASSIPIRTPLKVQRRLWRASLRSARRP